MSQLTELLKDIVQTEHGQWMRYTYLSVLGHGLHTDTLKEHFEEHAQDELRHAKLVSRWIVDLGDAPPTQIPCIEQLAASSEESIQWLLKAELDGANKYQIAMELAEGIHGLQNDIGDILSEEHEHISDLMKMLSQFKDKTDDAVTLVVVASAYNKFVRSGSFKRFASHHKIAGALEDFIKEELQLAWDKYEMDYTPEKGRQYVEDEAKKHIQNLYNRLTVEEDQSAKPALQFYTNLYKYVVDPKVKGGWTTYHKSFWPDYEQWLRSDIEQEKTKPKTFEDVMTIVDPAFAVPTPKAAPKKMLMTPKQRLQQQEQEMLKQIREKEEQGVPTSEEIEEEAKATEEAELQETMGFGEPVVEQSTLTKTRMEEPEVKPDDELIKQLNKILSFSSKKYEDTEQRDMVIGKALAPVYVSRHDQFMLWTQQLSSDLRQYVMTIISPYVYQIESKGDIGEGSEEVVSRPPVEMEEEEARPEAPFEEEEKKNKKEEEEEIEPAEELETERDVDIEYEKAMEAPSMAKSKPTFGDIDWANIPSVEVEETKEPEAKTTERRPVETLSSKIQVWDAFRGLEGKGQKFAVGIGDRIRNMTPDEESVPPPGRPGRTEATVGTIQGINPSGLITVRTDDGKVHEWNPDIDILEIDAKERSKYVLRQGK